MGLSKSEQFTKEQNEIAEIFRALGHPARIAIMEVLFRRNACFCGEIVDELPLSQATVSQHLKELKKANIIKGEIEGPKVCYCIDHEQWNKIRSVANSYLSSLNSKDCC